MPLWQIYHSEGTFTSLEERQAFTQDITKMYTELELPAFYVVANFIPLPTQDIWVGGEPKTDKPFVRIIITHIAIHVPDIDAMYNRTTARIDKILKPHVADRGYDWEYHIDETERRLWKVNGMVPPQYKSEEEKVWVRENKPVVYEGAYP